MPWVIRIGDGVEELRLQTGRLRFPAAALQDMADAAGSSLVFERVYGPDRGYFATARLGAINADDGGPYAVLIDFRALPRVVPADGGDVFPGQIGTQPTGIPEPGQAFVHPAFDASDMIEAVYGVWRGRCMLSGSTLSTPVPARTVGFIRPIGDGGRIEAGNLILARKDLFAAFRDGWLAIEDEAILVSSHLPPGLAFRRRPGERFERPPGAELWPDPQMLAWHARNIFRA